jgi:amino acid adenylation domain-containing protein
MGAHLNRGAAVSVNMGVGWVSCLHGVFAEVAAQAPSAPALAWGRERLTYGELERRANQLARHLLGLGVGPEVLVGICLQRSADMVVALLAVLKAGGAYVPLDPSYPSDRLAFMMEDAGAPVLLSQEGLEPILPEGSARRVFLDRDWLEISQHHGSSSPETGVRPGNLAYAIYTSGSTGRPKGVLIPHSNVVRVIREAARVMAVEPGSRVLQLASLSFDASVLEIFLALLTGSCLYLVDRDTLLSGEALARELQSSEITAMAIPPSLLATIPEGDFPALRSIIVGGEACPAGLANRWAPGRFFVNAYAPTESTIFSTAELCAGTYLEKPPLGQAISGAVVHLLDPWDLQPVAAGEPGEIHIGGPAVARGYLDRPALTAERFVPDPWSETPGGRLYRTGDLAQLRADGLEFLGRIDQQVKIRGVRIELGEIEAVLRRQPAVREGVVVAREDEERPGEKRLVAYVVPAGKVGVHELRAYLESQLPEAMVPSAFVFLPELPLMATGKVDRRALPAPGRARPLLATPYRAPETPAEEVLAAIWSELLGLDGVGVDDDLFELGGHSLLVTQIVSRVREQVGRDLSLADAFAAPTVAGMAGHLRMEEEALPELPPIGRAPRNGPLPLTFPQERVWFLTQLAPESIAYNFQYTLRLRGPLDPTVLERALTEIVRRHEVLRTRFPVVDGRPVQVIEEPWAVALPVLDVSGEEEAERIVAREISHPFEVTELPLVRWSLLRLGPDDHLLIHVEHHFVHDGWSLAVFLRELMSLYEAFAAGEPSPLPELPVQYADFAVWQRSWMQGEVLARELAWWKERLAGSLPVLSLPADRPRPRFQSFHGGSVRVDFPDDLYDRLRAFCRTNGTTLFIAMLAAFNALVHRYTSQEDVLLGSGLANRRLRETEGLIGMVVNTVLLRTSLAGDPAFRELLGRVRETTLEAHAHQDLPIEKLVQELQPDRDLGSNPLFQVLFSFHDAPVPDLRFAGISGEILERHNGSAKMDLNVVVKPRAEQRVGRQRHMRDIVDEKLTLVFEHSADLFDRATVERMVGHYRTLLSGAIENSSLRLSELPLLTPAERGQLAAWNETEAPFDLRPVHVLFAEQARRTPDALAVGALTYRQLDCEAGRFARRLLALGVEPEARVALLLDRSPELVIGALGTLMAGAAYLPLDPAYPPERLRYMLEDAKASAVLTEPWREVSTTVPVLSLGSEEEPDLPLPSVDPWNLAYVIYTSGSTGRPKGVELTHKGLANLASWHRALYEVTPADRATLLAGTAFDASVWEVWPYLLSGASLHVVGEEVRGTPAPLLRWLAEQKITLAFLPTPLAEACLAEEMPEGLALRALLTGGDKLHRAPRPGLPFRLVNHYGPTENTVVATAGEAVPDREGAPPIGRPIANARVHLVDRALNPMPVGAPGELLIGGTGLARGYHGRPDLTAERFVPDPFAAEPGGRLYRTGDLARLLRSGEIEFAGRIDHQVKLRGFRVELQEIEAVLAEHPAVREAAVVLRPESLLAAYVVPRNGDMPDAAELRSWLALKLPDYMVPQTFVPLPGLPLTPNGKLDARALPEPATQEQEEIIAPRTPVEELVAEIWGSFIRADRLGVGSHFFKLGGHSLLAAQMLSRLRDEISVELPLRSLFEAPTLGEFAAKIENVLLAEQDLK